MFGFGACRTLLDVSYPLCCKPIVTIKHILGLADQRAHALSVFDCVVKAKYFVFYSTHFCAWLLALASRHYVIASVSKIVRDFSEAFGAISRSETENTSRFKRVRLTHSRQSPGFWILDFHL